MAGPLESSSCHHAVDGSHKPVVAEIIAIGDEIVSGQSLDTNSQWLSQRCGENGISARFHTTVSDELPAMVDVFRTAVKRADVVLITGGLGPTADDLTREALAELVSEPLVLDEDALFAISERYRERGRAMPENNRRQALRPSPALSIPNPLGTAPGILLTTDDASPGQALVVAMPGVPREMKPMFLESVIPIITSHFPALGIVVHRILHCFGAGESDVELMLPDLIRRGQTPTVGITASTGTISLRITATAANRESCAQQIEPVEATIRETLGDLVFGDSGMTLERHVVELLLERQQSLAVVEIGMNGILSGMLNAADPTGNVFSGGLVLAQTSSDLLVSATTAAQQFRAGQVLAIGGEVSDGSKAKREVILLAEGEPIRLTVTPIRNSTINLEHCAKQGLNLLRRRLISQGVAGTTGMDSVS